MKNLVDTLFPLVMIWLVYAFMSESWPFWWATEKIKCPNLEFCRTSFLPTDYQQKRSPLDGANPSGNLFAGVDLLTHYFLPKPAEI